MAFRSLNLLHASFKMIILNLFNCGNSVDFEFEDELTISN